MMLSPYQPSVNLYTAIPPYYRKLLHDGSGVVAHQGQVGSGLAAWLAQGAGVESADEFTVASCVNRSRKAVRSGWGKVTAPAARCSATWTKAGRCW